MVTVTVDNRLRLRVEDGEALDRLKGACSHSNPAFHKARKMGFRYTPEPPSYEVWEMRRGELTMPRGRTADMKRVLADRGIDWQYADARVEGEPMMAGKFPAHRVDLWDHQKRIVQAVLDIEQGLIRAPTGSGKTTAGIAAIAAAQLPTVIVVWGAAIMRMWVERLCSELGLARSDVGVVGGGKERWRPVTVTMQQTLARSPEKLKFACRNFGFVMCDEVQRFAADTFLRVVDAFPARYRIGLSADETRKDRKEFLIYDMFGRVIGDIERHELEDKELVMPVTIKVVPTEFRAPWYVDQMRDEDANPDFGQLLEEMVADSKRNAVLDHIAANLGGPALVLTHRREHALSFQARMWASGRPCGLLLGGAENKGEFDASVTAMRQRSLNLGVGTYQAVGQGLDIKPIERAVCSTPIHSNRQFFGQVRGRICRKAEGKTEAVLVYLWDRHVFGRQPLHNLARWNDRKVLVLDGGEWIEVDTYLEKHR